MEKRSTLPSFATLYRAEVIFILWGIHIAQPGRLANISISSLTRKLCYRKDDRAMRAI